MSRDINRKGYYGREGDRRDRDWDRNDYRNRPPLASRKRSSRSRSRGAEKRRSRSPQKIEKDIIDDNILSEIAKLPDPSELWDNQFQEGGFQAPPPPAFQPNPAANTVYPPNYQQQQYTRMYDEFPSLSAVPTAPHPPDIGSWNQLSLPPPPVQPAPAAFVTNVEDQIKKEAAIESEMRHQKAALSKQREDYMKKAGILKKELETLKDQRNELRGDSKRSPSPDTKRFLKENTKLQLEIQNKLKTINNVVDMLNGIIGEDAQELHDSDVSPDRERGSKRKSRSPSRFNYVYYDPEMHWCRVCNEFPPTAKDYLNHLHSAAHNKMAAAHLEAPWHSVSGVNEGFPSYPTAPTKRTPIRGLQFFVPSTAWYCKLCDQFIGDLHCASAHLKSVVHSKNYTNFVEQNPHWETDWMSDRQKAFEKCRGSGGGKGGKGAPPAPGAAPAAPGAPKPQYLAHTITFSKDGISTRSKEPRAGPAPAPASAPAPPPDRKRKKEKKKRSKKKESSSSSSSDSSSEDSEPRAKRKKAKKERRVAPDDKTLTEWMSSIQMEKLNDSDRKLLDTLKSRMKPDKRAEEKRRSTDAERSPYERGRAAAPRALRESERREAASRDERERERERDREAARREGREGREGARREAREGGPARGEPKKPEIKKMPFIGKMPVYKNLSKAAKTEEQKKEENKKKEDEEATKKRREEMDAEIQKKVAEFKEKIAKAQVEREQGGLALAPPPLALPTRLGAGAPPPLVPHVPLAPHAPHAPLAPHAPHAPPQPQALSAQPPPPQPQPPPPANLSKDFQDALDIIFPSEVKKAEMAQQELFANLASGLNPGFPMPGVMPPFPPLGLMQPQMSQMSQMPQMPQMPQMMMGFDMNTPLFPPRPQLYDTHVPLVPSPKPRQNKNNHNHNTNNNNKKQPKPKQEQKPTTSEQIQKQVDKENGSVVRKKEELDDLAMLGIDASDVGANI